ncbi:MAG TPA: hypothetical protein VLH10_21500 [Yinghuangia sp.]|nr:hypothetical protein [Yinghuangia sp.]
MGRWVVVVLGLGVLVVALVGAADPYQKTREFRATVKCERGGDCFGSEAGSIVGRRTYTTTSTDSDGHTTTTTHFEVTWQRADGSRQGRDVSAGFYRKAQEGEPATLRLWRDEVVGVEVMGREEWFLPESAESLAFWFRLAYFGIGVLLWAVVFGWWGGFFMLCFRTIAWMFTGIVPVRIATDALAYGLNSESAPIGTIIFGVFFTGIAAVMLFGTLHRSRW